MDQPGDDIEECIYEGRLDGIFKGFRNHDVIFKFQGGSSWRQVDYHFEYHYLFSPKARIVKVITKRDRKETFYIEVDGVENRVAVKASYV